MVNFQYSKVKKVTSTKQQVLFCTLNSSIKCKVYPMGEHHILNSFFQSFRIYSAYINLIKLVNFYQFSEFQPIYMFDAEMENKI